jgi:hypothetical protein
MQATGANRVLRRLAATTGLLLMLAGTAAGADPFVADAATAAASQPLFADVAVTEVDVSVSALVDAPKESASTGDMPVRQADDAGAFLGQLVTQYFESYNQAIK